jgi:hypothetical protein
MCNLIYIVVGLKNRLKQIRGGGGGRLILGLLIKKLELSAYLYIRYCSNRLMLVVLMLLLLLSARVATQPY